MTSLTAQLAVCIRNDGYPVALELNSVYQVLPDPVGERYGLIRIVDETGEGALYPEDYFQLLDVPGATEADLLRAS